MTLARGSANVVLLIEDCEDMHTSGKTFTCVLQPGATWKKREVGQSTPSIDTEFIKNQSKMNYIAYL